MLVGQIDESEIAKDFKQDKSDARFSEALSKNKEFAVDPTHKSFMKTNSKKYHRKN